MPPAPPPPLTIWHVLEAFGVDKPMAACLAVVFFGAGAATWVLYGLNESHQHQERGAQAAAEQDRRRQEVSRQSAGQPLPAWEQQSSNEQTPRR